MGRGRPHHGAEILFLELYLLCVKYESSHCLSVTVCVLCVLNPIPVFKGICLKQNIFFCKFRKKFGAIFFKICFLHFLWNKHSETQELGSNSSYKIALVAPTCLVRVRKKTIFFTWYRYPRPMVQKSSLLRTDRYRSPPPFYRPWETPLIITLYRLSLTGGLAYKVLRHRQ